jgi:chromosome segregation protein
LDSPTDKTPPLKSLDLQGYKTFASKTLIALAPTITAVVGPNGTGKSNIADAIRWVLGEQSYSLLRGKKTEDMIFSGSEARPRASMASATITFDNSDGWLPIDFTEVSISRRAYRDGQNEYLLNGQRVRLRDVSELLARCGLAQRTYTIIGQGLVDAALSLKAEERRQLFEEAAGIGLYRTRREEALRRLDKTRRNLERVQDILSELRPRLRSLKRQAKRANAYDQVKQDLDAALRVWYGYHWNYLRDILAGVRNEVAQKRSGRDELREKQGTVECELTATRRRIDLLRSQLHTWSQQVSGLYGEREQLGRRSAVSEERIRWLLEQEEMMRSEVDSLEREREPLRQRLSIARQEVDRCEKERKDSEAVRLELEQTGAIDLSQRQALVDRAMESQKALERHVAEQAAWETRQAQLLERMESLEVKGQEIRKAVEAVKAEVAGAQRERQEAWKALEEAEAELQTAVKKEATIRQDISRAEANHTDNASQLSDLRARHASLQAKLQLLHAQADGNERVAGQLAEAVQKGHLSGWVGGLADHLRVETEHRSAIGAALGDFSESLAFDTLDDILLALDWLDSNGESEQAALLPLTALHQPPVLESPLDPGCLGNAARLVSASPEYQPAIDLLLGRTLIVRDRQAARRMLPNLPVDARLVTLGGDVYYSTGQVLVGGGNSKEAKQKTQQQTQAAFFELGKALREAEAEDLRYASRIEALRSSLEEALAAIERGRTLEQDARNSFYQAELAAYSMEEELARLQNQQRELEDEVAQLEQERDQLVGRTKAFTDDRAQLEQKMRAAVRAAEQAEPSLEMARVEAALEIARQASHEAEIRVAELTERLSALEADLEAWTDRLEQNQAEQSNMRREAAEARQGIDEIERQLSTLSDQMQPAEESLAEAEKKRSSLETQESQTRAELQTAERQHSLAQVELARRQEEMVSLKRRIEDDFGLVAFDHEPDIPGQDPLPLEGLVERLPHVDQLPLELEGQVNRLRIQLRRMGAVNPEAQREYQEVSERHDFLTSQMDDLRRAETQIQEVIAELDLLMEREFRKTFDAVAVTFRQTFTRLFGGGSARLVLTDPDDLTQSGIDIEARLPGRREQGLALLSGGERSLTACALIFALLKISPTPFCVLDEVDAMLDEANVIRFVEMLHELSEKTQFVVITHNRLTVQAAEVVYGVSMGADSVSRVISLKLDEAEREIAA